MKQKQILPEVLNNPEEACRQPQPERVQPISAEKIQILETEEHKRTQDYLAHLAAERSEQAANEIWQEIMALPDTPSQAKPIEQPQLTAQEAAAKVQADAWYINALGGGALVGMTRAVRGWRGLVELLTPSSGKEAFAQLPKLLSLPGLRASITEMADAADKLFVQIASIELARLKPAEVRKMVEQAIVELDKLATYLERLDAMRPNELGIDAYEAKADTRSELRRMRRRSIETMTQLVEKITKSGSAVSIESKLQLKQIKDQVTSLTFKLYD